MLGCGMDSRPPSPRAVPRKAASVKRTLGIICLAGALGALAAFEYALAALFQIGTCASGASAYLIARQCPPGTAQIMIALPVALVAALAGGAGAAADLGPRAGGVILCEP